MGGGDGGVCEAASPVPVHTGEHSLLAFLADWSVYVQLVRARLSDRAREGPSLCARHAREGWRLTPHGTVCYHSASLIPSPHVCNLTW